MAKIIYYENLDYDCLPTAKKRRLPNGDALGYKSPPTIILSSSSLSSFNESSNGVASNGRSSSPEIYYEGTFTPSTTKATNRFSASSGYLSEQNPPDSNLNNSSTSKRVSYTPTSSFSSSGYINENSTENYGGSNYSKPVSHTSTSSFSSASTYINENPTKNYGGGSYKSVNSSYTTSYNRPVNQQKPPDNKLLHDTLKKYFNFTSFRENQLAAVNASCAGLDTLILMPTGGGKSICYQLPAILSVGVTIVVSPLKSLIADQVQRMKSLNVKTSALGGDTKEEEAEQIIWDLRQETPEHKLLYVTPEKIVASGSLISLFNQLHKRGLLARFVIDEAHCVSMWGADFRPDYRKLGKLRQEFPGVPIMALTATAPPKVRDDILDQLKMSKRDARVFIQSFNRPNLKFEVRTKSKGCLNDICNLIQANFARQCGIVYCLSRNDCESTASSLREQGITSAPYHAGLPDEQRARVFNAWSKGIFQVVCATIAFGMGIDKSDVRFVIHYSMPKSVEGYYQEAGRAGRDGKFASCILYFSKADLYRMKSMLSRTGFGRKVEDKTRDHGNLQHMIDYVDNKQECRRSILLRYLGEEFNSKDCISHFETACDNCLNKMRRGH